ncbi:MAG: VOC family protein [Rubrivivax sp.]|nr:VOC family protein [Rubrivivax sp.]
MTQLAAYLSFDGRCAEAMTFYAGLLGAKLKALMSYSQAPAGGDMPRVESDLIKHAYLEHKDFGLMAGDTPPGVGHSPMLGVMLALTLDTVAEAQRIFGALAEGGAVQMPLADTFWAEAFGMVTGRFGTAWAINGASKPMPGA